MILQKIWMHWDEFWFKPQSTLPISCYRIVFGLLLLAYGAAYLYPELFTFFGDYRAVTQPSAALWWRNPGIDLLLFWPKGDFWLTSWCALFIIASFSLTLGFCTRASAFVVWIMLVSMHHDTFVYTNGGDVLMRLSAFYLIFSYAGSLYSIDSIVFKTMTDFEQVLCRPPWAQRLLQLQLTAIYFQCFWTKLLGNVWLDGSAVYYILKTDHYSHLGLTQVSSNFLLCQLLSWFTLATEFSLFTLIWFERTRLLALALGVLFHFGIDLCMNLPMFEYYFIALFLLFLDDADIRRILASTASIFKRKRTTATPA